MFDQVGGDGMFQEVLNGVMAVRSCGEADRAAAAAKLRLGHIPGGSTDAVAYSLNGTRSAATAALHVALGDRYVPGQFLFALPRLAQIPQRSPQIRWCSPCPVRSFLCFNILGSTKSIFS